ncbi:6852_t:CDS:2, partial [Dentiscutata erythropus]
MNKPDLFFEPDLFIELTHIFDSDLFTSDFACKLEITSSSNSISLNDKPAVSDLTFSSTH